MRRARVSFRDFWPGFDPEEFFLPLLGRALEGPDETGRAVQVVAPWEPCDLEIVSVFPGPIGMRRRAVHGVRRSLRLADLASSRIGEPSPVATRSIWFTAENIRPPHSSWHATWSFDADSGLARNRYFPLWFLLLPELAGLPADTRSRENRSGRPITLASAMSKRTVDTHQRPKFACAFIGNPEPTRMRAIDALRSIGEVDVYGPSVGAVVPSKWEVAREYRFMVCFENSVTPGYVTEKVFDAWSCGTVPIWNGLDRDGYLNEAAMVNLAALGGEMERLVDQVSRLADDPESIAKMAGAPILVRSPSMQPILESLRGA